MKRKWIFYGIALINMVLIALYIRLIPEEIVAVHYGITGVADRFGSKWSLGIGALLPPVLLAAYYELYCRVTKNNPRIMANRRYEEKSIPLIAMAFVFISWFMVGDYSEFMDARIMSSIIVVLGLLMIFLSNLITKIQPNRYFGIRFSWTLKDDEVWRQTHRMGGYCGVAGGFVMLITGIAGMRYGFVVAIGGVIIGILLTVVPPAIFAYRLYHERHG